MLAHTGDIANAGIAYRNALLLRPDLHGASINLGLLLESSGYPDQALRRAYEAMELVKPESDPFSFAMAQGFAANLHCQRREPEKAEQLGVERKETPLEVARAADG